MKSSVKINQVQQWVERIRGCRTQKSTIQVYLVLERLPNELQVQIWDAAWKQGIAEEFWRIAAQD